MVGFLVSIPTGAWVARLGGEAVVGAIAGIEGSVGAGGAVAAGAGAGALGDYSGSLVAAKIAAEAVGGDSAAAACVGKNSFTGDTPVLMADGTSKPIAEVKVGDEVRNSEPDDSFVEHHVVAALHITEDDHDFVDVTVGTSSGPRAIATTAHHRFWDETTRTWTDAADLRVGDHLSTPGGGQIAVQSLRRYAAVNRTYNLTIEDLHTYYVIVGETAVLVHNAGLCDWRSEFDNLAAGKQGHVRTVGDAQELRGMFDGWTAGAQRLPSRGAKIPDVYRLDDGTVMQWRTASQSGDETVDIFPPGSKGLKVHIGDE